MSTFFFFFSGNNINTFLTSAVIFKLLFLKFKYPLRVGRFYENTAADMITLSMLKFSADDILKYVFLFYPVKRFRHFMQNISI